MYHWQSPRQCCDCRVWQRAPPSSATMTSPAPAPSSPWPHSPSSAWTTSPPRTTGTWSPSWWPTAEQAAAGTLHQSEISIVLYQPIRYQYLMYGPIRDDCYLVQNERRRPVTSLDTLTLLLILLTQVLRMVRRDTVKKITRLVTDSANLV